MKKYVISAVLGLLAVLGAHSALASTIYSCPADGTGSANGWFGTQTNSGMFATTTIDASVDSFTLYLALGGSGGSGSILTGYIWNSAHSVVATSLNNYNSSLLTSSYQPFTFNFTPVFLPAGAYYFGTGNSGTTQNVFYNYENASSCSGIGQFFNSAFYGQSWETSPLSPLAGSITGTSQAITAFVSVTPTIATSTTVAYVMQIAPDDLASSTSAGGGIKLHSYISGIDTNFQSASFDWIIPASGTVSTSTIFTLPNSGTYHLYSSIYSFNQYGQIGQVFDSTSTDFVFNSSFLQSVYGTTTPSGLAIPSAPCGVTDLTGCVQNALVYLFYPNSNALDMYQQFITTLYQKPPVGYFAMIQSSLGSVTATSTGAITGWIIPAGIIDNFFTPVETAVAGVLGFFVLVEFYKRFKDVQL